MRNTMHYLCKMCNLKCDALGKTLNEGEGRNGGSMAYSTG